MADKKVTCVIYVLLGCFIFYYLEGMNDMEISAYDVYNYAFNYLVIPGIYALSFIILFSEKINGLWTSTFLVRLKNKKEIIVYAISEMLIVNLFFVCFVNIVIFIYFLIYFEADIIFSSSFLAFLFMSMLSQYMAWNVVGSIFVLFFVVTKRKTAANLISIAIVVVMSMSSRITYTLKDFFYDFCASITVPSYCKNYMLIIKHVVTNLIISFVLIIISSIVCRHMVIYERDLSNEEN